MNWESFGRIPFEHVPAALGTHIHGTYNPVDGNPGAYLGSVLVAPLNANRSHHNGAKNKLEASLPLYSRLWNATSKRGDNVGDFFSGSGSGTIAALISGRNVINIDRNQDQVRNIDLL